MRSFFLIPDWWKNGFVASVPAVPYQVVCVCGQSSTGVRQLRHQVVRCSHCNRELFVLPLSPLPSLVAPGASEAAPKTTLRRSPWFWPVVAGGLTFALSVVVLIVLLDRLVPGTRSTATAASLAPDAIDRRLAVGRQSLLAGEFQQALDELDGVQQVLLSHPGDFTATQRRQLRQLQRQAALLVDWPREPLERMVGRAAGLNAQEWQTVVGGYRGKAFIFDLELRRDASRHYHVRCVQVGQGPPLRLELETLKILGFLPLEEPQRVLFAARLAEVRRDGADSVAVRLEPESGVLLTDIEAAVLGGIVAEAALQPLLQKQQQWVAELP
jgi:hypothetical protein